MDQGSPSSSWQALQTPQVENTCSRQEVNQPPAAAPTPSCPGGSLATRGVLQRTFLVFPASLPFPQKITICKSEHNWNKVCHGAESLWDSGESTPHASCGPPPADCFSTRLLLLTSSCACSLHSHINHLNPHARVTAKGLCPAGITAVVSKRAPCSSGRCPAEEQAQHTAVHSTQRCSPPFPLVLPGVCAGSPPGGRSVCGAQAVPVYHRDAARPPCRSPPLSPPPPGSSTRILSPRQLRQV